MQTLPYGYLLPENPDTGDVVFPALEANWVQVSGHDHDGVNSAPLASSTASIAAGDWLVAPIGGGVYYQAITIPNPFLYDTCQMWFTLSTGQYTYPTIERVTNSEFRIYTNDNTLVYKVFYR